MPVRRGVGHDGGERDSVVTADAVVRAEPQAPAVVFEDGADLIAGETVVDGERAHLVSVEAAHSASFGRHPQIAATILEDIGHLRLDAFVDGVVTKIALVAFGYAGARGDGSHHDVDGDVREFHCVNRDEARAAEIPVPRVEPAGGTPESPRR